MKYKVGDKVRIRKDLQADKEYAGCYFNRLMAKHCGKVVTIDYIFKGTGYFTFKECGGWQWSHEMLEEVDKMKYKVGDKVRVRGDLVCGRTYGGYLFTKNMSKICGETVKIKKVGCNFYYLEGYSDYHWTDEMLEDVERGVMINIYVDGNIVAAQKGDKVGVARCHPEDKFDIFTGAKLALERLEEKCKPYGWLKEGCRYWIPDLDSVTLCKLETYTNSLYNKMMLERGIVFETKEEAIKAAKKMLAVLKKDDSNDS